MDQFLPMGSKEFKKKFGGLTAKRTVDIITIKPVFKSVHRLKIVDSSGDVVYEERFITKG